MSINKVILVGNVDKDPEIRALSNGKEVANFSLATSDSWKDKDGVKQERTEWHRIVVYSDGLVKVIKNYVKKGSKIYVSGKVLTRKWQDNLGKDRYSTEIVLQGYGSELQLLDSKGSELSINTEPAFNNNINFNEGDPY